MATLDEIKTLLTTVLERLDKQGTELEGLRTEFRNGVEQLGVRIEASLLKGSSKKKVNTRGSKKATANSTASTPAKASYPNTMYWFAGEYKNNAKLAEFITDEMRAKATETASKVVKNGAKLEGAELSSKIGMEIWKQVDKAVRKTELKGLYDAWKTEQASLNTEMVQPEAAK